MSFETTLRATELTLALALLISTLEHLRLRADWLHATRLALTALLATGLAPLIACAALLATSLALTHRHNGPFNGGADRMCLLILTCLTAAHLAPTPFWREAALGYLAVQLTLSYFISGWVKVVNPDWRSGVALQDVFRSTGYPATDALRALADRPAMLTAAGWAVMLLELAFPLALITSATLTAALIATAAFHLANAILFGFNRFFWTWLAAYPALIWFQERIFG